MKKSAFTMIELIIVIVVAGILAAVMIPRLERDNLREAANQVVRHIHYTQHLAMMNDVYDAGNASWYQNRWSINLCSTAYAVERANGSATAEDPLTQRGINGTDNNLADMGVAAPVLSSNGTPTGCRIIFDHLGRPYRSAGISASPIIDLMDVDETVSLSAGGRTAVITITRETGYITLDLN